MLIDDLLAMLDRPRRNGSGWTARCPAHEDRNPSLSIAESDGRILIHCHVGCSVQAVCDAIGVRVSDLFADSGRSGNGLRAQRRPTPHAAVPEPVRDWMPYARECYAATDRSELARELGVHVLALDALRVGRDEDRQCWTFPMRDDRGRVVGIRTRHADGSKRAVTGSRNGLFYAANKYVRGATIWVCEGPTDCAALLSIGCAAVGRPSNTGGHNWLVFYLATAAEVFVVADRDEPGSAAERYTLLAANQLAAELRRVKLVRIPGRKDARDFVRNGGTRTIIEALAAQQSYL